MQQDCIPTERPAGRNQAVQLSACLIAESEMIQQQIDLIIDTDT